MNLSTFLHNRPLYLALFVICLLLLSYGLVLEHINGIEPCPLCIFQRIAYIIILVISCVAAIHNPRYPVRQIYNGALLVTAGIGAGIAMRQVWLQHLPPDQVPECGPGLEYMLEVFPLSEALQMILSGSGECAEIHWIFIGLSIAEWSLIWFMAFMLTLLLAIFYRSG